MDTQYFSPKFSVALFIDSFHKQLEKIPDCTTFCVRLNAADLCIPWRVYKHYGTSSSASCLDNFIHICLNSRHHCGFTRQDYLKQLLKINHPCVVPFVLQLISEYVVEIIQDILNSWQHLSHNDYSSFLMENQRYFATLKRRVISYWDCYYRWDYPDIKQYPGYLLSEKLDCLTDIADHF